MVLLLTLGSIVLLFTFWYVTWINGICAVAVCHKQVSKDPISALKVSWEEEDSRYDFHNIPERFVITGVLEKPKAFVQMNMAV